MANGKDGKDRIKRAGERIAEARAEASQQATQEVEDLFGDAPSSLITRAFTENPAPIAEAIRNLVTAKDTGRRHALKRAEQRIDEAIMQNLAQSLATGFDLGVGTPGALDRSRQLDQAIPQTQAAAKDVSAQTAGESAIDSALAEQQIAQLQAEAVRRNFEARQQAARANAIAKRDLILAKTQEKLAGPQAVESARDRELERIQTEAGIGKTRAETARLLSPQPSGRGGTDKVAVQFNPEVALGNFLEADAQLAAFQQAQSSIGEEGTQFLQLEGKPAPFSEEISELEGQRRRMVSNLRVAIRRASPNQLVDMISQLDEAGEPELADEATNWFIKQYPDQARQLGIENTP